MVMLRKEMIRKEGKEEEVNSERKMKIKMKMVIEQREVIWIRGISGLLM